MLVEFWWMRGLAANPDLAASKYSFFQIGTICLRRSIAKRQASKASARRAAAIAMRTIFQRSPASID